MPHIGAQEAAVGVVVVGVHSLEFREDFLDCHGFAVPGYDLIDVFGIVNVVAAEHDRIVKDLHPGEHLYDLP